MMHLGAVNLRDIITGMFLGARLIEILHSEPMWVGEERNKLIVPRVL